MNLLQIGTVKVRFSVPEQEIAAIGADSRMRITVPALGDRTFQAGKIEKGAVANPAAHTYDVRAALANAGGELLPGMVCRVEVSPAGAAEQIALPCAPYSRRATEAVSYGPCAATRPCVRP